MHRRPLKGVDSAIVSKSFAANDRRWVKAQQTLVILLQFVAACRAQGQSGIRHRMTYEELAESLEWTGKMAAFNTRRPLGLVGLYCAVNGLPLLNLLVVNKASSVPGLGAFIYSDSVSLIHEQNAALYFQWSRIRVPTPGAFRRIDDDYENLMERVGVVPVHDRRSPGP